jgi:DNA mismatch endonuclease (patch repair protein)
MLTRNRSHGLRDAENGVAPPVATFRGPVGAEGPSWQQCCKCMAPIPAKDTKPEMVVRNLVWRLGARYRLHVGSLPGCPDLVFPSRRRVIFVHGCFWHRHSFQDGRSMPASRVDYWQVKFERNRMRDRKSRRALTGLGWRVLVVWECQTKKSASLEALVRSFLSA